MSSSCPQCGATDKSGFSVTAQLIAKSMGTYSLAGAQMKFSALAQAILACDCGWFVNGHLEGATVDESGILTGGHFVPDEG